MDQFAETIWQPIENSHMDSLQKKEVKLCHADFPRPLLVKIGDTGKREKFEKKNGRCGSKKEEEEGERERERETIPAKMSHMTYTINIFCHKQTNK